MLFYRFINVFLTWPTLICAKATRHVLFEKNTLRTRIGTPRRWHRSLPIRLLTNQVFCRGQTYPVCGFNVKKKKLSSRWLHSRLFSGWRRKNDKTFLPCSKWTKVTKSFIEFLCKAWNRRRCEVFDQSLLVLLAGYAKLLPESF